MKFVEINWHPTNQQLRQFAVACLVFMPCVAWLWGAGLQLVSWLALAGTALAMVSVLQPRALRPLFLAVTIAATPIGVGIGELVTLLIYFGVFLPIGLVFRLARRDALRLSFDAEKNSYWTSKKQPRSAATYYRQF